MTIEELLIRAREEGREEGRKEAKNIRYRKEVQKNREKLFTLAKLMDENGESDQVGRLLREPDYLDEMLHKYQLES